MVLDVEESILWGNVSGYPGGIGATPSHPIPSDFRKMLSGSCLPFCSLMQSVSFVSSLQTSQSLKPPPRGQNTDHTRHVSSSTLLPPSPLSDGVKLTMTSVISGIHSKYYSPIVTIDINMWSHCGFYAEQRHSALVEMLSKHTTLVLLHAKSFFLPPFVSVCEHRG